MMASLTRIASVAILAVVASSCTTVPKKDLALEQAKAQLEQLKSDDGLEGYAPLALSEAERAVRLAENATGNEAYRSHLVYMADRRIQIARAAAQHEQLEDEIDRLEDEHNEMLLRISQREAGLARREAEQARMMSAARAEDADRARQEAQQSQLREEESSRKARHAQQEASAAKALASSSATAAELARREADLATEQADSLRRQLENLQLRQTESGVVVTLGDVLFETGQSHLKQEAEASLVEVVDLLQSQPDNKIRIEGHSDSTGDTEANLILSEKRARNVMEALVALGVDQERIKSMGMGEDFPIASNDSDEGRSQNRRVDVILLDD